jgi:hypothetical protein
MSPAPTPITIQGKKGTVVYLDADWNVVPAKDATRAKVVFMDGETAWFTPTQPDRNLPGTVKKATTRT